MIFVRFCLASDNCFVYLQFEFEFQLLCYAVHYHEYMETEVRLTNMLVKSLFTFSSRMSVFAFGLENGNAFASYSFLQREQKDVTFICFS